MLEYLINNIFVVFGGHDFQQTVGIPMETNCAPLLADLFLYSYEADFMQNLLISGKKTVAKDFKFTYRENKKQQGVSTTKPQSKINEVAGILITNENKVTKGLEDGKVDNSTDNSKVPVIEGSNLVNRSTQTSAAIVIPCDEDHLRLIFDKISASNLENNDFTMNERDDIDNYLVIDLKGDMLKTGTDNTAKTTKSTKNKQYPCQRSTYLNTKPKQDNRSSPTIGNDPTYKDKMGNNIPRMIYKEYSRAYDPKIGCKHDNILITESDLRNQPKSKKIIYRTFPDIWSEAITKKSSDVELKNTLSGNKNIRHQMESPLQINETHKNGISVHESEFQTAQSHAIKACHDRDVFQSSGIGDIIESAAKLRIFGNKYIPSFFTKTKAMCTRKIKTLGINKGKAEDLFNFCAKKEHQRVPRTANSERAFPKTDCKFKLLNQGSSRYNPQKSNSEIDRVLGVYDKQGKNRNVNTMSSNSDNKEFVVDDNKNLIQGTRLDEPNRIFSWNSRKDVTAQVDKNVFKSNIQEGEKIQTFAEQLEVFKNSFKDAKDEFSNRKFPYSNNRRVLPQRLKRSWAVHDLSTIESESAESSSIIQNDNKESCTERNILIVHQDDAKSEKTVNRANVLQSDRFPSYIPNDKRNEKHTDIGCCNFLNDMKLDDTYSVQLEYHTANEQFESMEWSSASSPPEHYEKISPFAEYSGKNIPWTLSNIHIPLLDPKHFELVKDKNGFDVMVGSGAYGSCFLATKTTCKSKLVIKEFQDGISDVEIINEARILRYLWDTGFVPDCIGIISSDMFLSSFVLVQEYYGNGVTLKDLLKERNREPSCREWLNIAHQLVSGLEYIHRKHVLLNDIKADNILVDASKRNYPIRYIDMGVASFRSGYVYHCSREYLKKYYYLAPEVRRREPSTTASDVFSLGQMIKQINTYADVVGLECLYLDCVEENPKQRPKLKFLEKEIRKLIILY